MSLSPRHRAGSSEADSQSPATFEGPGVTV